jgi:hypothetical protein
VWAASAAALLALLASSILYPDVSGNPSSRFATMESLVERGTFAIDGSAFAEKTVDKVFYNGHQYSTKPAVLSTIGAGIYWLVHAVTGWSFRDNPRAATTAVRVALQILPFGLFLLYFWRFSGFWIGDQRARRWIFFSVALASYLFGYSSKLNNHAPAAFLIFASFYHAHGITHRGLGLGSWIAAGVFAGLAATLDMGTSPMAAALGLYLLLFSPWRALLLYAPTTLIPLVPWAWINIHLTGSPLPFYLQGKLYRDPRTYWRQRKSYDALREPKALYLLHMIFGHHGWLSMSPSLVLAFPGARSMWREGHRREALLLALPSLFVLFFYAFYTNNYGGGCGGMRWLIVTDPFWLLAVAWWLDRSMDSRRRRGVFGVLAAIGGLHAWPMVWDPWTRSPWHRLFQQLGLGSI